MKLEFARRVMRRRASQLRRTSQRKKPQQVLTCMRQPKKKIDVSNKESGNEAINTNQENMEDEGHIIELSDGFKSPESQTNATYANQLRKSRLKEKNVPTQKKEN